MSGFKRGSNICSFALLLIAVMVAFGLREGRQGDLLGKCVDPCALCRHNEEEQCNDDFCCTTCGSTECKCKTCGDTGVNSGFEWRDDL